MPTCIESLIGDEFPSNVQSTTTAVLEQASTCVDDPLDVLVRELRALVTSADKGLWAAGDLINEYRSRELKRTGAEPSYKTIAEKLNTPGWGKSWVQRLAVVAMYFPSKDRCRNWIWNDHYRRYQNEMRRRKVARGEPADINKAVDGNGVTDMRAVSRFCADANVIRWQREILWQTRHAHRHNPLKGIAGKVHLSDWQDVYDRLPNGLLQVAVADPPFGRLGSYFQKDTRCERKFALGYECANHEPAAAVATTLPLFDHPEKYTKDAHYTWWDCGRSYLCRIIDMLHMGYVDEVLFGREVVERLPLLVQEWVAALKAKESSSKG